MCLFLFWFPWCVCPAVGWLGHKAVLFPVLYSLLFGEKSHSMAVPLWWKRKKFVFQKTVSWCSESVLLKCSAHICVRCYSMGPTVGLWRGSEWNGEKDYIARGSVGAKGSQWKRGVLKDPGGKKMGRWESVCLKSQFLCMKYATLVTTCLQSLYLTPKLRHQPLFPFVPPSPPNLPSRFCTHLYSTVTLFDVFTPSKCSLFSIKTK